MHTQARLTHDIRELDEKINQWQARVSLSQTHIDLSEPEDLEFIRKMSVLNEIAKLALNHTQKILEKVKTLGKSMDEVIEEFPELEEEMISIAEKLAESNKDIGA
jgi:hypothetical protein